MWKEIYLLYKRCGALPRVLYRIMAGIYRGTLYYVSAFLCLCPVILGIDIGHHLGGWEGLLVSTVGVGVSAAFIGSILYLDDLDKEGRSR